MADLLAVLAEPRRRDILRLVWSDERTAGDIASRFAVTFGAVSQHLRVMREAGLVSVERRGKQRWYRARRQAVGSLRGYLEHQWRGRLETLKALAEAEERAH
jgi:DNA-binding transcriptional ArsR family regulator